MRVSTTMMFEIATQGVLNDQAALLRTQQQMAAGTRMLAPSDDPIAASQALGLRADLAQTAQHRDNRDSARAQLEVAETTLGAVGDLLASARALIVDAGNGSLVNADRQAIAAQLRGLQAELLGMANARDGQGRYLFAGFQDGNAPFTQSAAGVLYNGDQGNRALAVTGSRQIEISDNGHSIFQLGRSGNGVFKASVPATNAGAVISSVGSVYDATLLTGHSYRIVFGSSTYDILDLTASTTLSAGNAYTSGASIRFEGIDIGVEGAPAAGDRIDVTPSTSQSVFAALANAISAVAAPGSSSSAAAEAQRTSGLGAALAEIDSGAQRALTVRADLGSRLGELENLNALGESESTLIAAQLSKLEDLDYARAASDFQRQQLALQAALQTQVRMSALSLFNYLT